MNTYVSYLAFVPPGGGVAPPGTEFIYTLVQWVLFGASAILFIYFVSGLVRAAQTRQSGGQADVAAPVWPLVAAVVLAGSSGIWVAVGAG